MTETAKRLADVRAIMSQLDADALFIPRADEYLGEYIPEHNERLHWISGFTGSAGMVVVLRDRAAIFVDGRYTVQVRKQVDPDHFEFLHLLEEPPAEWLAGQLDKGARVAYDPRMHTWQWLQETEKTLDRSGIELLELDAHPVDACWQGRPQPELHRATLMPESLTGRSSLEKRRETGAAITARGADAALIFAADSNAWLLNIRGNDVPCLPVVLGFGLLYADGNMQFFTDPAKIPPDFGSHAGDGVEILSEADATSCFEKLAGTRVLVDPATANAWCHLALQRAGAERVASDDPVIMPKACKNESELEGMRQSHQRDAVAVVRFLAWLDREVEAGRLHSEAGLSDRLYSFRSGGAHFRGPSFDTISAAAGNAAMCHYNHENFEEVSHLEMDSGYLVDSGGQYLDGTTDITRTVAIGDPGAEIRERFTLVLKGHIALNQAVFPEGTTGTQLDAFARQFLWRAGLDYDHGTGHGVGAFLSVHEGPQRIAKVFNGHGFRAGMVVSNEPGYYLDNAYGIRCENLEVVRTSAASRNGEPPMLEFETLTLVPWDARLIDIRLLDAPEVEWIDRYHATVREALEPELNNDDLAWLQRATRPLTEQTK